MVGIGRFVYFFDYRGTNLIYFNPWLFIHVLDRVDEKLTANVSRILQAFILFSDCLEDHVLGYVCYFFDIVAAEPFQVIAETER